MKQVWITGPQAIDVRDVPEPVVRPGDVVVETAYAGICGSDLHTFRRGHPWLPYPIAPGHEASGVIVSVGSDVDPSLIGSAVYVQPAIACGDCFLCHRGKPNLCERLQGVGSHMPGAFSERYAVPASAAVSVPEGISLLGAALIEPFATAVHAIDIARDIQGATVVVIGGGSIGLAVLLTAQASGAAAVVVIDPVERKRQIALGLGASAAIEPSAEAIHEVRALLGGRPDVIMDCVASAGTLQSAVAMAAPGGTVVIVGVGHGPVEFEIEALQDREVMLAGSAMYVPHDFVRAAEIVRDHGGDRLVTATLPIDEAPRAIELALSSAEVKIHLTGPRA